MDDPQNNSQPESTNPSQSFSDDEGQASPANEQTTGEFDIQAFEATRSLAARQAQRLQKIKKEFKLLNEQLKNVLENDAELVTAQLEAKELNDKVKTRKTEILETTEAKNIKLKIIDLKEERAELEDSLSNHLFNLYQTTGVMEFEDPDGHVWEYNIKAKIKTMK